MTAMASQQIASQQIARPQIVMAPPHVRALNENGEHH